MIDKTNYDKGTNNGPKTIFISSMTKSHHCIVRRCNAEILPIWLKTPNNRSSYQPL